MKQGRIETITTRIISTTFVVVALAVFKPFGLDAWHWQAYIHLVVLGVIGLIVRCHRAFLVNLGQVEQIVSHSGTTQLLINHCHESLPVSRSNMSQIKTAIKGL